MTPTCLPSTDWECMCICWYHYSLNSVVCQWEAAPTRGCCSKRWEQIISVKINNWKFLLLWFVMMKEATFLFLINFTLIYCQSILLLLSIIWPQSYINPFMSCLHLLLNMHWASLVWFVITCWHHSNTSVQCLPFCLWSFKLLYSYCIWY